MGDLVHSVRARAARAHTPCRSAYAERGVKVIAVSFDDPDQLEEKVRPFFAERAPDLISYLQGDEDQYSFVEAIDPDWPGVLPTTFFYGKGGELAESRAGRLMYHDFERKVVELLEAAI